MKSSWFQNLLVFLKIKKAPPALTPEQEKAVRAFQEQIRRKQGGRGDRPERGPRGQDASAKSNRPDRGEARPPREPRLAREGRPDRPPRAPLPSREEVPTAGPSEFEARLKALIEPKKIEQDKEEAPRVRFADMGLDARILDVLKGVMGFEHATPVQGVSVPLALAKRNVIVSSATGSGKTFAFVLPMLHRMLQGEIHQALILSPTREIAIQTNKNIEPFLAPLGLTSALVIGGTDMHGQKSSLRQYPPILVATPGRLVDMLQSGLIWLQYTDYVVLDEADRMLDMGFEEELMKVHKELPGTHQTLLFTATLLPEVMKVAEKYGSDYEKLQIGRELTASDTITHSVIPVPQRQKLSALKRILQMNPGRSIIFFNTIKEAIFVTDELKKSGYLACAAIHSGKTQEQRNRAILDLREGRIKTLLGTDVAARGIDIPLVELVINYDLPNNPEEYIHRIGRTGRAGYTGVALSLLGEKDGSYLESIERILKTKLHREEDFHLPEDPRGFSGSDRGGRGDRGPGGRGRGPRERGGHGGGRPFREGRPPRVEGESSPVDDSGDRPARAPDFQGARGQDALEKSPRQEGANERFPRGQDALEKSPRPEGESGRFSRGGGRPFRPRRDEEKADREDRFTYTEGNGASSSPAEDRPEVAKVEGAPVEGSPKRKRRRPRRRKRPDGEVPPAAPEA